MDLRVGAVAVALVLVVSAAVLKSTDDDGGGASFDDIPEGVSAVAFGATPTFVVRNGDSLKVLLTDVQHLAGEEDLWWCPGEQLFASPAHGELFDIEGRVVGGPARAGLNRVPASVVDGRVVVDENQIVPGGVRPASLVERTMVGPGAWDSGPSSFCDGAVHAQS